MRRCFLAFPLDATARAQLQLVQQELTALPWADQATLRPVPARNLHLTLRFIGEVDDSQLERLGKELRARAPAWSSRQYPLRGLAAFPHTGAPRAIVALPLDEGLLAIATEAERLRIDAALGTGAPRPPHVTVMRLDGASGGEPLAAYVRGAAARPLGCVDGSRVLLCETVHEVTGSRYQPLVEVPLTGGAP
jgi:RNA 2',3'-cyclic 3'-phosphodiesterase